MHVGIENIAAWTAFNERRISVQIAEDRNVLIVRRDAHVSSVRVAVGVFVVECDQLTVRVETVRGLAGVLVSSRSQHGFVLTDPSRARQRERERSAIPTGDDSPN